MGEIGVVKVEVHPMSLRSIVPVVPKDEGEKRQLVEDLTRIGCEGLLVQPWCLKSEDMVGEFSQVCSNEWKSMIQRDPEQWTTDM